MCTYLYSNTNPYFVMQVDDVLVDRLFVVHTNSLGWGRIIGDGTGPRGAGIRG